MSHGLIAHFFLCRTALLLYSTFQTGYESNAPVEDGSTDVTTVLLPSRTASIGSTYNSGEDIGTTSAVLEVDERSKFGMLASALLTREKMQPHLEFSTLTQEIPVSSSAHIPSSTRKLVVMHSHKRKSSRDPKGVQESCSERAVLFLGSKR